MRVFGRHPYLDSYREIRQQKMNSPDFMQQSLYRSLLILPAAHGLHGALKMCPSSMISVLCRIDTGPLKVHVIQPRPLTQKSQHPWRALPLCCFLPEVFQTAFLPGESSLRWRAQSRVQTVHSVPSRKFRACCATLCSPLIIITEHKHLISSCIVALFITYYHWFIELLHFKSRLIWLIFIALVVALRLLT